MGQLIRPLLLVSLPDFFSSREKNPIGDVIDPLTLHGWTEKRLLSHCFLVASLSWGARKSAAGGALLSVATILASVKSLGEGSNVCLVAAPGAQQLCLDIREKILFNMMCLFSLSSG